MTSGQTRAIKSRLLTTSFGNDTSATRVSSVLAPNGTATPSRERSLSSGTKLNGPNDMTTLVGAAGSIMTSPSHLLIVGICSQLLTTADGRHTTTTDRWKGHFEPLSSNEGKSPHVRHFTAHPAQPPNPGSYRGSNQSISR